RYGIRGGVGMPLVIAPLLALAEWSREARFDNPPPGYQVDHVIFPWGLLTRTGLIVGWPVDRLRHESEVSQARVGEAESLRDELGRRADVMEAATRCARALSSSLDLDEAFEAFIRELRGLVPFDRMAIVLEEGGAARVIAVAGVGADILFTRGSGVPVGETLLGEIMRAGQPVYREDMNDRLYPEEDEFIDLGLRCRIAAPLLQGPRAIGMISLVRREANAFKKQELELVALLGRLVASAVQNIRAYEAERSTVEELRRLSALRADFVSLVSHELRAPMASVVGSAQTLRQRWREVTADQRGLIFEKFGRGATAGSPGTPGTGLGLFIARSIAVAHGGSLELSPNRGKGATFALTLPVESYGRPRPGNRRDSGVSDRN